MKTLQNERNFLDANKNNQKNHLILVFKYYLEWLSYFQKQSS